MDSSPYTSRQKEVVRRLIESLNRFLPDTSPTKPTPPTSQDHSNVFAVDGARGAGKSTVLTALYTCCSSRKECLSLFGDKVYLSDDLFVTAPLDCSILPAAADVTPGMAALVHLDCELKRLKKSQAPVGSREDDQRHEILGSSAMASPGYASLVLDLSTDPSDYGDHLATGIHKRLMLRHNIGSWLKELGVRYEKRGFVLLLDDFDLVDARQVRAWLRSFMDELAQTNLAVVLTSDFDRLDYLAFDYDAQIDDKTGRAFIQKAIPAQNRQRLRPFTPRERQEFRGGRAVYHTDEPELGVLLRAKCSQSPLELAYTVLLPRFPRGLVNLYEVVRYSDENEWSPIEILATLAVARAEPLLARRLESPLGLVRWMSVLPIMDTRKLSEREVRERWARVISAIASRFDSSTMPSPIPEFVTIPTTSQAVDATPRELRQLRTGSLGESPDWHDPLRHPELRYAPLRDASTNDQPYWAEVIANVAFADNGVARWKLLTRWWLLRSQFEAAHCRIPIEDSNGSHAAACAAVNRRPILWRWLEEDSKRPLASGTDEVHESLEVGIGCWPLLTAISGERGGQYPYQLFERYLVRVPTSVPATSAGEGFSQYDMLPARLAGLILFADGLRRAPWVDVPRIVLSHDLRITVALAAAFTRIAYLYTAWVEGKVCGDDAAPIREDSSLVGALRAFRDNNAVNLLRPQDDHMLSWAHEVMTEEAQIIDAPGLRALAEAYRAYQARPEFCAARELAAELIEEKVF